MLIRIIFPTQWRAQSAVCSPWGLIVIEFRQDVFEVISVQMRQSLFSSTPASGRKAKSDLLRL